MPLQRWFLNNIHHPYIKKKEKDELCKETGLTRKQINGWLTNNRKRKYQKVVEAAKARNKDFSKWSLLILDFVRQKMQLIFDKDLD